jgi:hypothetical protein
MLLASYMQENSRCMDLEEDSQNYLQIYDGLPMKHLREEYSMCDDYLEDFRSSPNCQS